MFDLGIQELIVIFIVALIVLGPKRLPELGRTLGKGIVELKRAMENVRDQMHAEVDAPPKPPEAPAEEEKQIPAAPEEHTLPASEKPLPNHEGKSSDDR